MNIFSISAMNFSHTAFRQVISKVSVFVWSPLCKVTQRWEFIHIKADKKGVERIKL